jgi:hypothetical protein
MLLFYLIASHHLENSANKCTDLVRRITENINQLVRIDTELIQWKEFEKPGVQ